MCSKRNHCNRKSNADKANCRACVPIGVIGFVESTLPQEETMDREAGMRRLILIWVSSRLGASDRRRL